MRSALRHFAEKRQGPKGVFRVLPILVIAGHRIGETHRGEIEAGVKSVVVRIHRPRGASVAGRAQFRGIHVTEPSPPVILLDFVLVEFRFRCERHWLVSDTRHAR